MGEKNKHPRWNVYLFLEGNKRIYDYKWNNGLNEEQQIVEEVSEWHKKNLTYFLNKSADQMNSKKIKEKFVTCKKIIRSAEK